MMRSFSFKCKACNLLTALALVAACEIDEGDDDYGFEEIGESGETEETGDDTEEGGESSDDGDSGSDGTGAVDCDVGSGESGGSTCESTCSAQSQEDLNCGEGMRCVPYPTAPMCEECP